MRRESRRKRLILASSSPRRKELLEKAGYRFEVDSPSIDESTIVMGKGVLPEHYVESLAYFKARAVAERHEPSAVILGADTDVFCDGKPVGKPHSEDDARRILREVSSKEHTVITAVAIIDKASYLRLIGHDKSYVRMRPLTDEQIEEYIRSGNWKGKAGAYAIQEGADRFVERLEGSFTNVVGLPMELVEKMLACFGIYPEKER